MQPQPAVLEAQIDMIMRARRLPSRHEAKASRHAEMDDERALAEVQQQILAAPLDVLEALAGQPLGQPFGQRPAQARHAQHRAAHGPTEHTGAQSARNDFDFGQFRHGLGCR